MTNDSFYDFRIRFSLKRPTSVELFPAKILCHLCMPRGRNMICEKEGVEV